MYNDFGSTFLMIVVMLLVLLGAYFTTKYLSRKSSRQRRSRYIRVLDRMTVAKEKQILLIEAGKEHYLLGVTSQSISVIGTIDKEELDAMTKEAQNVSHKGLFGFFDFIKKTINATDKLKKTRMQAKENIRDSLPPLNEKDDIEKIIHAIRQRQNRFDKSDKKGEME